MEQKQKEKKGMDENKAETFICTNLNQEQANELLTLSEQNKYIIKFGEHDSSFPNSLNIYSLKVYGNFGVYISFHEYMITDFFLNNLNGERISFKDMKEKILSIGSLETYDEISEEACEENQCEIDWDLEAKGREEIREEQQKEENNG